MVYEFRKNNKNRKKAKENIKLMFLGDILLIKENNCLSFYTNLNNIFNTFSQKSFIHLGNQSFVIYNYISTYIDNIISLQLFLII